jgi:hypothetical protein
MEAAQPTFNQVYDLACMLPRGEQKQLLNQMIAYIIKEDDATLRERRARIKESEEQIAAGQVYSEEESDKMIEKIFDDLSSLAA